MKKLFFISIVGIISGILLILSCVSNLDDCSAKTYTYDVDIKAEGNEAKEHLYVYEIHTLSGICDTVKISKQIKDIHYYDLGIYIDLTDELGVKYCYVDRIRRLPDEIKIIKYYIEDTFIK